MIKNLLLYGLLLTLSYTVNAIPTTFKTSEVPETSEKFPCNVPEYINYAEGVAYNENIGWRVLVTDQIIKKLVTTDNTHEVIDCFYGIILENKNKEKKGVIYKLRLNRFFN